jgi:hypothetical protein
MNLWRHRRGAKAVLDPWIFQQGVGEAGSTENAFCFLPIRMSFAGAHRRGLARKPLFSELPDSLLKKCLLLGW